jgi:CO/xanthine dehydrogenase Mo-binding subunit
VRATRVVAHESSTIVNPHGLRNQIEGNVIQAISRTLKAKKLELFAYHKYQTTEACH